MYVEVLSHIVLQLDAWSFCPQLSSSFSSTCCLSYQWVGEMFQPLILDPWAENHTLIGLLEIIQSFYTQWNDIQRKPSDPTKVTKKLLNQLEPKTSLQWAQSQCSDCPPPLPQDSSEQKVFNCSLQTEDLGCNAEHCCVYGQQIWYDSLIYFK